MMILRSAGQPSKHAAGSHTSEDTSYQLPDSLQIIQVGLVLCVLLDEAALSPSCPQSALLYLSFTRVRLSSWLLMGDHQASQTSNRRDSTLFLGGEAGVFPV